MRQSQPFGDTVLHRTEWVKQHGCIPSEKEAAPILKEINPYWLLTGKGEMFGVKESERKEIIAEEYSENYQTEDVFENALLKYLDKPKIQAKLSDILNKLK